MTWRKFVAIASAVAAAAVSAGLLKIGIFVDIQRSNACSPEHMEKLNNPDGDAFRTAVGCLPSPSPWSTVLLYALVLLVPLALSVVLAFATKKVIFSALLSALALAFIAGWVAGLLATLTPFDNFSDIAAGLFVAMGTFALVIHQAVLIETRRRDAAAIS